MRFGRVEVTPRAAGWLPPHLTTPSGGMGVLKPAEQVLMKGGLLKGKSEKNQNFLVTA